MVGWLVGWLVDWLVGRLVGCLAGRSVSSLVGWFVGWLAGWFSWTPETQPNDALRRRLIESLVFTFCFAQFALLPLFAFLCLFASLRALNTRNSTKRRLTASFGWVSGAQFTCPGLAFAWLAWFARLARWLASLTWLSWFTWLAWFAWLLDLLRLIASLCLLASLLKLRYLHAWDWFSLLFKLYLFSWLARLAHSLVLNFLKHDFFEKNRNFSA